MYPFPVDDQLAVLHPVFEKLEGLRGRPRYVPAVLIVPAFMTGAVELPLLGLVGDVALHVRADALERNASGCPPS